MNLSPTTDETSEDDAGKKSSSRCAAMLSLISCGGIVGIVKGVVKNYTPSSPPTTTTTLPGDGFASHLPGAGVKEGLEFFANPESETSPSVALNENSYLQEYGGYSRPDHTLSFPEIPTLPPYPGTSHPDASHLPMSPSAQAEYIREMSLPTTLSYDFEASMPQHYL